MAAFLFKIPVNTALDAVVGLSSHFAPCPPIANPSLEGSLQGQISGKLLNRHAMAYTVVHRGRPVVQVGHDLGPFIPHLTAPVYSNPWYLKIFPAASHKTVFPASTVKIEGKPAACATYWPTLPMLSCGEPIPLPSSLPLTTGYNSALVGMTYADLLAGLVTIAATMAIEWLFRGKVDANANKAVKDWAQKDLKTVLKQVLSGLKKSFLDPRGVLRRHKEELFKEGVKKVALDSLKTATKAALASLTGFVTSTLEGDPTFAFKLGDDRVLEVGVEYKTNPKDPKDEGLKWNVATAGQKVDSDRNAEILGEKVKD